jgi:hypothetical protein
MVAVAVVATLSTPRWSRISMLGVSPINISRAHLQCQGILDFPKLQFATSILPT